MSKVYVGVDTNILCNFGHIERLSWKKLFPEATSVHVLISAKVQAEMDVHKDKASGYVLKRAREYQGILRKAEEQDYSYSFDNSGVNINFVFLDRPRTHELDHQRFELEHDDERIVAEYFHEQKRRSVEILILANDARPIRVARQAGMVAIRPNRWDADRVEPEDEKLKELRERNRELERLLGARPKTQLADFAVERQNIKPLDFSRNFDVAKYLARLGEALKNAGVAPSPEALADKYGLDDGYFGELNGRHLTSGRIYEYESDLENYYYSAFAFEVPELLRRLQVLGSAFVFDVEVENVGEAPEEMLSLELKILQNAVFINSEELEPFNDWGLIPPTAPAPRYSIFNEAKFPDSVEDTDHEFILVNDSEVTETHRCRSMLHGHKSKVECYIRPLYPKEPVSVLVTLRAKNLVEPIYRKAVIRPRSANFDEELVDAFLVRQSVFIPEEQRDVLLAVLKKKPSAT
ncbi:hypothetical protein [Sinorhizobium fredii]|uniref:hypothetical protein n=1 Tax=Rhizobium fredii TaxID=380 RepID=UPI003512238F